MLSQDSEDLPETSRLLSELYKVLCEACRVYLFNTEDPFASVGIDQAEFYGNVVAVMSQTGQPEQWIKEAILLSLEPTVTLDHSLMVVLLEMLKSAPLKETAIALCEQLRKIKIMPDMHRQDPKYYLGERNNALTTLIFMLNMALSEKEAAITDLKSHYKASNVEIGLYVRVATDNFEYWRETIMQNQSRLINVTTIGSTPSGDSEIVSFELAGQSFMAISAGPYFKFNPSLSLMVACDSAEEVDAKWKALSEGGSALMEIGEYPFSKRYGWIQDSYGLSWQLMLVEGGVTSQKITVNFLFSGDASGKAEEAVKYYTELFPQSEIQLFSKYGEGEAQSSKAVVN